MELTEEELALFKGLISSVRLIHIEPVSIHSDKTISGALPPGSTELTLNWNQAFAEDDSMKVSGNQIMLSPRYEFTASLSGKPLFSHTSVFVVIFGVQNNEAVDNALASEPVKKVFFEKQIMKTMWPILRQQILDGMSRLGLPAIPLPWIVE